MMASIAIVLTTLAVCFLLWVGNKLYSLLQLRWRNEEALKHFPQIKRHWLWGATAVYKFRRFGRDFMDTFIQPRIEEYKYCHVIWLGPFHATLTVYHPDIMKIILKRSDGKGTVYNIIKQWLGEGLITSNGERWFRDRRLLTNAFHFEVLKPYVKLFNNCSQTFLDNIARSNERGESFDGFDNVSKLTLDILFQCAFSMETNCQLSDSAAFPYLNAVRHLLSNLTDVVILQRNPLVSLFPVLKNLSKSCREFSYYCRVVHDQANSIIEQRRKKLEVNANGIKGNKKYMDFIDVMLSAADADGNGLSNAEIRDEVDTFMFAGHDTTASAITWTLYCLAKHPEHQTLVKEEVDSVLNDRESSEILWEDFPKLNYVSQCVKEAMRLYSTVPVIQRRLEEDVEIQGHKVLAGTNIGVHIYGLHHNPHIWDDPLQYKPERFSPENCTGRDSHAYIPFSAGPRNCLGKNFAQFEEKVVIGRILHKYKISLESPDCERPFVIQAVMKSDVPLMFKFTPWE